MAAHATRVVIAASVSRMACAIIKRYRRAPLQRADVRIPAGNDLIYDLEQWVA
jgi:hypothetical protein